MSIVTDRSQVVSRTFRRGRVPGRAASHLGSITVTRASLDKRPADVAAMFDRTAARYDLLNDLMTAGMDRRWRREVVRAVAAGPGELVLDLAAGTGTSSVPFADS